MADTLAVLNAEVLIDALCNALVSPMRNYHVSPIMTEAIVNWMCMEFITHALEVEVFGHRSSTDPKTRFDIQESIQHDIFPIIFSEIKFSLIDLFLDYCQANKLTTMRGRRVKCILSRKWLILNYDLDNEDPWGSVF